MPLRASCRLPKSASRNSDDGPLRRMLSHSAGWCYDEMSPLLHKWRAVHNQPLQPDGNAYPDVPSRFLYPLITEPGTQWRYSPAVDWAGLLVERLTGGTLEEFMIKNIFEPLGMRTTTFFLQKRPDMIAKRVDMTLRNKETGRLEFNDEKYWHEDTPVGFGGMTLKTTPNDFMQLLHAILLNDGRLLSPALVEEMFRPQLNDETAEEMNRLLIAPPYEIFFGRLVPGGIKANFGLGGLLAMEDVLPGGWRRKGSMVWYGLPNLHWVGQSCRQSTMRG
jgi:CubicO group peptidase (beta-lactamase class C family)